MLREVLKLRTLLLGFMASMSHSEHMHTQVIHASTDNSTQMHFSDSFYLNIAQDHSTSSWKICMEVLVLAILIK